jgi:hypothetical protein
MLRSEVDVAQFSKVKMSKFVMVVGKNTANIMGSSKKFGMEASIDLPKSSLSAAVYETITCSRERSASVFPRENVTKLVAMRNQAKRRSALFPGDRIGRRTSLNQNFQCMCVHSQADARFKQCE